MGLSLGLTLHDQNAYPLSFVCPLSFFALFDCCISLVRIAIDLIVSLLLNLPSEEMIGVWEVAAFIVGAVYHFISLDDDLKVFPFLAGSGAQLLSGLLQEIQQSALLRFGLRLHE
jgi:hypothetical protein